MTKYLRIVVILIPLVLLLQNGHAQTAPVSEPILQQAIRLTAQLPANIQEAYRQKNVIGQLHDSLEQMLQAAYPALADRMKKRSARLNAMINYNAEDAVLSLMPPNQKLTAFFTSQWDKMDALERTFNKAAPSFYGDKELYKKKGYLVVWDSVYRQRRPALMAYRDGIVKLVQADIAYLKANAKMFVSKDEAERMQWVEAELGVLQKLVLLGAKFKKVVMNDGVEKEEYCINYPSACTKEK